MKTLVIALLILTLLTVGASSAIYAVTLSGLAKETRQADIDEWNRIKGLPQAEKGPAAEKFWKRFVKGGKEPFKVDDAALGDREVDIWDVDNNIA